MRQERGGQTKISPHMHPSSPLLAPRRSWLIATLLTLVAACGGPSGDTPNFEHGDPEAQAVVDEALDLSAAGNHLFAFAKLEEALPVFPDSFELQLAFADAAARTERLAVAIETFEELLKAEPTNAALARKLAQTALSGGFLEPADRAVETLVTQDSPEATDYQLASQLAFEHGDLEVAIEWADRAAALAPTDPSVAYQLARSLVAQGNDRAQAALERTLVLDPGQAQARFSLGTLFLQAGDTEAGEAQLALQAVIRKIANKKYATLDAAERLARAQRAARALPTWSRPQLEIARIQLERGQPKKALLTLESAASLLPDSLDLYELHYATALALGQKKAAKKWARLWKQKAG